MSTIRPDLFTPPHKGNSQRASQGLGSFYMSAEGLNQGENPMVPVFYLPESLSFITWDAPRLAHTGIDIDYKMTAYDWFDRELAWSVSDGPTGMTVDADGTLHWTPSEEGSELVTVECSLGGQVTLSKTFTIPVDNSRCLFIATDGNDTTGDGSVNSPYATFEKVAAEIRYATTSRLVYHRSGTYTKTDWVWFGDQADLAALAVKDWVEDEPLLIRNYPQESVTYQINSGSGWDTDGDYLVIYGMNVDGGDLNERGGLVIRGNSVGKKMKVYNYQAAQSGNCAGIKHEGAAILDQCQAWDNYDRADPNFTNSSNYIYYGDKSASGQAYVIDCLSDGLGTRHSAIGFKIKHAGDNPPHYHKCADTGTLRPFSGIQGKMTVRKSVFFTDEPYTVMIHNNSDQNSDLASEGFLIEDNFLYAANNAKLMQIAHWSDSLLSDTPPLIKGNKIISESTGNGNILTIGESDVNTVPAAWDVDYNDNEIYTASPSNSVVIEGVAGSLPTITSKGTGNAILQSAPDFNFSAAGRDFTIANGVCSEVGV